MLSQTGTSLPAAPVIELSNNLGPSWEDGMEIDFQGPRNASESVAARSSRNIASDFFIEVNLPHSLPPLLNIYPISPPPSCYSQTSP